MRLQLWWWQLLLLLSVSSLSDAAPAASTTSDPTPQSTACGTIVNSQDTFVFNASLAYECLTSVPFNPAVATRFLQYYNDTLKFQSTLAYLKSPPSSYQQPGVDLLAGLEQLQQGINNGIFPNQYEFEAALARLLYAAHDGHVNLIAGILAAFSFAGPYEIVSVSIDGVQIPKVYLAVDLDTSNFFTSYTPSAITSINGIDATTYLDDFAANNSFGTLEPHADWNQLMESAALDIQSYSSVFGGGATFYPGDTITFKLENGTEIRDYFLAIYYDQGPTGPLLTGGDFYNFFVLGFYPASFDPNLIDNNTLNTTDFSAAAASAASSVAASSTSSAPQSTSTSDNEPACIESWQNPAYPDCPDVAQTDLGIDGYVSGYFLNSSSISVLSIPSFEAYNQSLNTFKLTVAEFITRSLDAKLGKVVIDVQSNLGGQPLLAIDTFKHFFPNIDPFAGSRMRAHFAGDVMGQTITTYFEGLNDTDSYPLVTDEWVASDRIDAETNRTFASWAEFFGPHAYDGDEFTTTQRYNLSDTAFIEGAAGYPNETFTIYGYDNEPSPANNAPPFAAEDIIILSDGICESACALFMEMMHHEAGVKVVVAGGRPSTGPMQAPSGTRGALMYSTDDLDSDISLTQNLLAQQGSPNATFLPNRTEALDVYVLFASINLRDQVRRDETTPLQFAYEAADCRIFYTPQTVYNYTALWQYAADATWSNSSRCVEGSTGFGTTGANKTDFVGPSPSSSPGTFSVANTTAHLTTLNTSSVPYLDKGLEAIGSKFKDPEPCESTADCHLQDTVCVRTTSCGITLKQCLPACLVGQHLCKTNVGAGTCKVDLTVCDDPEGGCQTDFKTILCVPTPQCSRSQKGNPKSGPAPPRIKPKSSTNLGFGRG